RGVDLRGDVRARASEPRLLHRLRRRAVGHRLRPHGPTGRALRRGADARERRRLHPQPRLPRAHARGHLLELRARAECPSPSTSSRFTRCRCRCSTSVAATATSTTALTSTPTTAPATYF